MSDNGQPKPPGRCQACHQDVEIDRFFQQGQHQGVKFHRDHVGQPCGPVFTQFFYRLILWIQPPNTPGRPKVWWLTSNRPIVGEEQERRASAYIAQQFTTHGPDGAVLVGMKPEVEVLYAELTGAR